jgi:hypothetical protein
VELSMSKSMAKGCWRSNPARDGKQAYQMSSKKKVITIAVTTVALSLGSIGIASANNSKSSIKVRSTSVTRPIANPGIGNPGRLGVEGQSGALASVLAGLVTKGTLTQAQVDAINAAITAARTANQSLGSTQRTAEENLIASTLGITVATLETRLAAGDSLATIAGAKTSALITALVADATSKIDAAVTAGKITAAQATTFKANLTAQITAMVNGTRGFGRGMGRGMGHRGEGRGPGMGTPFQGATPAPVAPVAPGA